MRYTTRYRSFNCSSYFPAGVKWLIITNVAIFLLTYLGGSAVMRPLLLLALTPIAVLEHFAIYQLVTYMFLHGGIDHILFNMLALWMFGMPLEQDWATRPFLKYYFLSGIGAGICDVPVNALVGNWGPHPIAAS